MILAGLATGAVVALVAALIPWLPSAASTQARQIDNVYWLVTIICVIIFAIVGGVSIYAVWKFRAPPDDIEDGSPIHGHTGIEIAWTAIPLALVTAITVYSSIVLHQVSVVSKEHGTIQVTTQQFAWSFTYPSLGGVTKGDLVLAVGRPVELELKSLDVIHSFWVPQFRMKQDAVPGITTHIALTPTKIGTYPVICTELCGLGHSSMRAKAIVMSLAEYGKWVRTQKGAAGSVASSTGGAGQGKALFTSAGCNACHTLAAAGASGKVGPDLDKVLQGKSADFIRQSIVDPNAQIAPGFQPNVMPQDFQQKLSSAQLDALVQFLVSATKKG